jgi:hypothetical protein
MPDEKLALGPPTQQSANYCWEEEQKQQCYPRPSSARFALSMPSKIDELLTTKREKHIWAE